MIFSPAHPSLPIQDRPLLLGPPPNTERWIRDTLDRSNRIEHARLDAAGAAEEERRRRRPQPLHFVDEKREEPLPREDNPYARKEVTYVCETGAELAGVVGGVFRRVQEARELGESHDRGVEARQGECRRRVVVAAFGCE